MGDDTKKITDYTASTAKKLQDDTFVSSHEELPYLVDNYCHEKLIRFNELVKKNISPDEAFCAAKLSRQNFEEYCKLVFEEGVEPSSARTFIDSYLTEKQLKKACKLSARGISAYDSREIAQETDEIYDKILALLEKGVCLEIAKAAAQKSRDFGTL